MKRRQFLTGLIASPAVIRTPGLLMPVKPVVGPVLIGIDWARSEPDVSVITQAIYNRIRSEFLLSNHMLGSAT